MTSLILATAMLLSGCTPQPGLQETTGTTSTTGSTGTSSTQQSSEQTSTTGTSVAQESGSTNAQQSSAQKKDEHRFVSERNFQLDKLARTKVKVGEHVFNLWVMDAYAKRMEGMMFLKDSDFKDDEGMIFVFLGEEERRFWMRNTLVDLDVCYCDKDGKIVKTYTMTKLDEDTDYSSGKPAMYVIELRAGTLKKLKITQGMKFSISEDIVSKDDDQGKPR